MNTGICTLKEASGKYLEYLKSLGKSQRTIYTYGKDLEQIIAFFGTERLLKNILKVHVGSFLRSDELLKLPKGGLRAKPTIDKTIRVLRMFFLWAYQEHLIEQMPITKEMQLKKQKKLPKLQEKDIEELFPALEEV